MASLRPSRQPRSGAARVIGMILILFMMSAARLPAMADVHPTATGAKASSGHAWKRFQSGDQDVPPPNLREDGATQLPFENIGPHRGDDLVAPKLAPDPAP